jgi:beta-1,2-mannobiose phosphorylase / 1,2-beta-oligomannan phosphorylase
MTRIDPGAATITPPRRAPENPIITPAMIPPSSNALAVVGVFNPAVARHRGETILLLRVAEAPADLASDEVGAPIFDATSGRIRVKRWPRSTPGLDLSDSRLIGIDGRVYLTSISHLRVARSPDGVHFAIAPKPAMVAATPLEGYGVEDPRITTIGNTHWINYTAVSSRGIATALASTTDFERFERHGVIFAPDNRDVTIFPEQIDGKYVALHRPMPSGMGLAVPAIWLARSTDLRGWGEHAFVAGERPGQWDDAKIGGGAVPFRVRVQGREAWLAIYHGVTASPLTYSLGALLLDGADPATVIGRSREPILKPDASYETQGFFARVVFTCGALVDDDRVRVYYGAADGVTCVADLSLAGIIAGLELT